ncbi:MAG: CDGSH iron-sulfur domain-containing protein [Candidatus Bathyarchaeota archaeon]|nr:CDGSH iron-sulfur domain-containing protein [Candidatus Bathyarchaeota archaeon]
MTRLEDKNLLKQASASQIRVFKDGPYLVSGGIPLFEAIIRCDGHGIPSEWVFGERIPTSNQYILCRCGQSSKKPFCDGTHVTTKFNGTETSRNQHFDELAKIYDGPTLKLKDAELFCASARFCHRGGDIWLAIPKSDDSGLRQNAIENACDCPSGRLVVIDKGAGRVIEPLLEKTVGIIEDPSKGVGGPLWVRGGIPVFSAEGKLYEVRNRVTLCRCGKSSNKPFCDSSHYPEEDQEVIENEQKPKSSR